MAYVSKPSASDLIPTDYDFASGGSVGTISQTEYVGGYADFTTPAAGTVLGDKPTAEDFNLLVRQATLSGRYAYEKAAMFDDYRRMSFYGTDATALQTFMTEVGATKTGLIVDVAVTIATSKSIPSNIHVICTENGSFTISPAQTLTINGQFDAPLTQQVFNGAGSVSFGATPKTLAVMAEWFGGAFGTKPSQAIEGQAWWDSANSKFEVYDSAAWTDEVCNKLSNPDTGWAAPTGSSDKSTFATTTVTTQDLAEFVKAMYEALVSKNILST